VVAEEQRTCPLRVALMKIWDPRESRPSEEPSAEATARFRWAARPLARPTGTADHRAARVLSPQPGPHVGTRGAVHGSGPRAVASHRVV